MYDSKRCQTKTRNRGDKENARSDSSGYNTSHNSSAKDGSIKEI